MDILYGDLTVDKRITAEAAPRNPVTWGPFRLSIAVSVVTGAFDFAVGGGIRRRSLFEGNGPTGHGYLDRDRDIGRNGDASRPRRRIGRGAHGTR
jgi:hypothetical protein